MTGRQQTDAGMMLILEGREYSNAGMMTGQQHSNASIILTLGERAASH